MRNARDRGLRQRSGVIHAFDSTRQTIRSKKRQATEQTRGEEANTNKEPKTEPHTFPIAMEVGPQFPRGHSVAGVSLCSKHVRKHGPNMAAG